VAQEQRRTIATPSHPGSTVMLPADEVLNRVMIIMARFSTWALVSLILIATVASLLEKPLISLVAPVYAQDHCGSAVVEEVGSEPALPGATVRASKRSPSDRADRSTIQSPRARARSQKNGWLTRAFFEGDTGFEPVTSSVSAGLGRREMGSARRLEGPRPSQLVRFAAATMSRKSSPTESPASPGYALRESAGVVGSSWLSLFPPAVARAKSVGCWLGVAMRGYGGHGPDR
jgi:hypothetical protein